MPVERWRWNAEAHPRVSRVFSEPAVGLGWCGQLETAPADAVVGKVLCVCAGCAIAREVLAAGPGPSPQGADAVALLANWIDGPTDERFERICSLIEPEELPPDLDPHGVVGWALRIATSSVGNFEAGWAFETLCGAALSAGFSPEQLRRIPEQELWSRKLPSS